MRQPNEDMVPELAFGLLPIELARQVRRLIGANSDASARFAIMQRFDADPDSVRRDLFDSDWWPEVPISQAYESMPDDVSGWTTIEEPAGFAAVTAFVSRVPERIFDVLGLRASELHVRRLIEYSSSAARRSSRDALAWARGAVWRAKTYLGPHHWLVISGYVALSYAYYVLGNSAAAEYVAKTAVEHAIERKVGRRAIGDAIVTLAFMLFSQKKHVEAEEVLWSALTDPHVGIVHAPGGYTAESGVVLVGLAAVLAARQRTEPAKAVMYSAAYGLLEYVECVSWFRSHRRAKESLGYEFCPDVKLFIIIAAAYFADDERIARCAASLHVLTWRTQLDAARRTKALMRNHPDLVDDIRSIADGRNAIGLAMREWSKVDDKHVQAQWDKVRTAEDGLRETVPGFLDRLPEDVGDEIAKSLPAGTAFVRYFPITASEASVFVGDQEHWGKGRYLAIVIIGQSPQRTRVVDIADIEAVEKAAEDFRSGGGKADRLRALAAMLVAKIIPLLVSVNDLVIERPEELVDIPIGDLPVRSGKALREIYSVRPGKASDFLAS